MTIGVDSTSTSQGWVGSSESSLASWSEHPLGPGAKPQWRTRSSCEADTWQSSVMQIVFRSDPGKFMKLKHDCNEFFKKCDGLLKCITSLEVMVSNIEAMGLPQIVDQVCNWQDTAILFVGRLSEEYAEYVDVVQPVQVAVYEMKLGSSLVLASVFQKDLLSMVELDDMDLIMGTIYSFMRFPRGFPSKLISVNLGSTQPQLLSYDIDIPTIFSAADMTLLEKLVTFSNGVAVDKVSVMQLKASLHQNVLVRVAHHVANTQLIDKDSFKGEHENSSKNQKGL